MSATKLPESVIAPNAVIHPTANVYQSQIGASSKLAAFVEAGGCVIGEPCALIGYEKLKLHWDQALSELGRCTEQDRFYPYVVYQTEAFQRLEISGNCPVAEHVAREIARCHAS